MFCVVGHHSRREQAERLAYKLAAKLFIDPGNHGSNWNHRRALEWASQQNAQVIFLEDDAQPVPGFDYMAYEWIERFPDDVISFYLGTGRPPQRQMEIATRLIDCDKHGTDFIRLNRLVHGVCYTIPTRYIAQILTHWNPKKGADYAISDGYRRNVIYPAFSLVDHADTNVVELHPDKHNRTERRKAWRLFQGGSKWLG